MSNIHKYCSGCGALLQTTDPNALGYTNDLNNTYCLSCYQLKHYGIVTSHLHPKDMPKIKEDALILMMSSVLHLDMLFSYPIHRYQPKAKYIYLINQMDLLPKSTNLDYLLEQIRRKGNKEQIPYEMIIFMSALKQNDVLELKKVINTYKEKDVYLVGVQNSGKTTLFKSLVGNNQALAFKKAGLTQETLVETFEGKTYYDMAGLYQSGYLNDYLPYETYKRIIPDKTIKPKIYQMNQDKGLLIFGLVGLSYTGDDKTFVFYVANQTEIHFANPKQIEKRISSLEPRLKVFAKVYETKHFKVPHGKQQITFADLGILHLEGPCTLHIHAPKNMHISVSEALFK